MGKGSKRRPQAVDMNTFRSNWDRIFKNENSKITRCETCHSEVRTIRAADEFVDYCCFCERVVEGHTYEGERHD